MTRTASSTSSAVTTFSITMSSDSEDSTRPIVSAWRARPGAPTEGFTACS
jgi:hypothetical protein